MSDAKAATASLVLAKQLQSAATYAPDEGHAADTQHIIPMAVVRDTRGYIERVSNQINGSYERGWYDACAVMIRRLLETLIIEAFEAHSIASKIKNGAGDFFHLRDLVTQTLAEPSWNLGRNTKAALPKLKGIGDLSAHVRRYNARKPDIEPLIGDVRVVVEEFVYLARLRT